MHSCHYYYTVFINEQRHMANCFFPTELPTELVNESEVDDYPDTLNETMQSDQYAQPERRTLPRLENVTQRLHDITPESESGCIYS